MYLLNPPPPSTEFHVTNPAMNSSIDVVIPPREQRAISTKISIRTPAGTYGRIAPRSGLAAKHMIDVQAGVIDRDYTGEVVVLLLNHSTTAAFSVSKGDRIAQLVLEKIESPVVTEVLELDDTARGVGGFGSTGL